MTDRGVFGGGLNINFKNIEELRIAAKEGNDKFSVLSTNPQTLTSLSGNLGSDTFEITPRTVEPVISKNLLGHRGIVEHTVESIDQDYSELLLEGVAVNILDNDAIGYINVVETEAVHVLTENEGGSFIFHVYPTRVPDDGKEIFVNVVAQTDIDGTSYLLLSTDSSDPAGSLLLKYSSSTPPYYTITVTHNADALPLTITDAFLIIRLGISDVLTTNAAYNDNGQTIKPVNVRLLPAFNSEVAKSIAVVEPFGRTFCVEGPPASPGRREASYDIYLRPCNEKMKSISIDVIETVSEQVELTIAGEIGKTNITSNDWGTD